MSAPSPSVLTPDEILAHPSFPIGRAMRQVTFNIIISLHLNHDVTDRATWPTLRRRRTN
ncbi:MAG: hypothetical protein JO141_04535 [Bradyrhizobium sp.]|nr:hypothetical protein [Bradyrhizobium sp.]